MSEQAQQQHPLTWPENWPRTAPIDRRWSQFGERSIASCYDMLCRQMRLLAGSVALGNRWLLSSNVPRNKSGAPQSNTPSRLNDPGVALYFQVDGRPAVLACDKWLNVQDNLYAIVKHIEALRGQKRWGVGNIQQAFRGYLALPALGEAGGIQWWTTLGIPINSDPDTVKKAYLAGCKKWHPDVPGGDREKFDQIQKAYQMFEQNLPKS